MNRSPIYKRVAVYGIMTALMLSLGLIERQFILVPAAPGIRLGLSNAVLLCAVFLMGVKSSLLLLALKVLLGGLLYAGVTGLCYGAAGGLCAMGAMLLAIRIRGIGMAGVSVCGAAMHIVGQIAVSRLLLGSWAAAVQLPILLVAAVIAGVATGITAQAVLRGISHYDTGVKERMKVRGMLADGKRGGTE